MGRLEAIWGFFGKGLGNLGGFQGTFSEYFWKMFYHLEQNVKIAKNLRKPMVFHKFLRFREGWGPQKITKNLRKPMVFNGFLSSGKVPGLRKSSKIDKDTF